jgi:hypothetical protein
MYLYILMMSRYCKLKTDLQQLKKGWKRSGAYELGRVLEQLALGAHALGNPDRHHLPPTMIKPKPRREGAMLPMINPRSSSRKVAVA